MVVSWRSSVSSRSLLWCISLLGLTVHALLRGMGALRRGVPLPWPGWWTPVVISNHGKTHLMYLDHVRPFGAVRIVPRFRFVFLVGPSDAQGSGSPGSVAVLFPVPFTVLLPVLPFGCGACELVLVTLSAGEVNQRVGRCTVVWCMCVLTDSAREF